MFNKMSELLNSLFFYFHFFILKFLRYEKLAMTSQFDLTRFFDVIIRNSFFLTREYQIPYFDKKTDFMLYIVDKGKPKFL